MRLALLSSVARITAPKIDGARVFAPGRCSLLFSASQPETLDPGSRGLPGLDDFGGGIPPELRDLLDATEELTSVTRLVSEAELYGRRFATGVVCPAIRARGFRVTGAAPG